MIASRQCKIQRGTNSLIKAILFVVFLLEKLAKKSELKTFLQSSLEPLGSFFAERYYRHVEESKDKKGRSKSFMLIDVITYLFSRACHYLK